MAQEIQSELCGQTMVEQFNKLYGYDGDDYTELVKAELAKIEAQSQYMTDQNCLYLSAIYSLDLGEYAQAVYYHQNLKQLIKASSDKVSKQLVRKMINEDFDEYLNFMMTMGK